MKVDLVLPPSLPGPFLAIFSGIDFKTGASDRAKFPANVRAIVERVTVVHEIADTVTNGVRLKAQEFDVNSPTYSTQATDTTNFSVPNAELTFTAVAVGSAGNGLIINFADPGAPNSALSVEYVEGENAIYINLATDGSSVITTTAAQVKAAIEADATTHALVTVAFAPSNDGTGVVAATILPVILQNGHSKFEGEVPQTIVNQVDTADTVAVGSVQVLTVAATSALRPGSTIELIVALGATATENRGSVIFSGIAV